MFHSVCVSVGVSVGVSVFRYLRDCLLVFQKLCIYLRTKKLRLTLLSNVTAVALHTITSLFSIENQSVSVGETPMTASYDA